MGQVIGANREAVEKFEEALGKDDNRPAILRLTTTRDGNKIETVKQVDFQDDDKSEWLTRNRTRLKRVGG